MHAQVYICILQGSISDLSNFLMKIFDEYSTFLFIIDSSFSTVAPSRQEQRNLEVYRDFLSTNGLDPLAVPGSEKWSSGSTSAMADPKASLEDVATPYH